LFFYVKEDFKFAPSIEENIVVSQAPPKTTLDIEHRQAPPKTILNIPSAPSLKDDLRDYKDLNQVSRDYKKDDFKNVVVTKKKQAAFKRGLLKAFFANLSFLVVGVFFAFGLFLLEIMFRKFGIYFFDTPNLSVGLAVLFFPLFILFQVCVYFSACIYFKSIGFNSSFNARPFIKILFCSLLFALFVSIIPKSIEFLPVSDLMLFTVFLWVVYGASLVLAIIANGVLWFYPCKLAFGGQRGLEKLSVFFDWCAFGFFLSGITAALTALIFIGISFPTSLLEHKFFIFKYPMVVFKYLLLSLVFGSLFKLAGVFYGRSMSHTKDI
jgi:hypothetical protein